MAEGNRTLGDEERKALRKRLQAEFPRRPGEPDEQAKAVLFLASDDASFIAGTNLFVDGGTMAMASFASPAKRKDGK